MKISRTKNASRNIFFGIILKLYQIIMPFIMRTIMIYYMGIEFAGLNNLFISLLQVLNLAELGIGAALTFSMYEPIAKKNTKEVCALLNLYKKAFRVIGSIILIIGLSILPIIPKLISGKVPGNLNIFILYLFYLGTTVISYWLYAYKNSLLYANQRVDVSSKIMIITSTVQYTLQIISLIFYHNYYYYLISSVIYQISTNIITSSIVDKMYPNYYASGKVDKETYLEIRKKVFGLITNKFGSTLLNSTDSIIISSILGLKILASYQNYFYIITAVTSIIYIIYSACIAGIGNSLILENEEKNYDDFNTFTFIIAWINIFCCSCFICLYQPFIKLWVGTDYLLDNTFVILLIIYFFIYEFEQIICAYKDAAGIWYEDRYRPLVTGGINLLLSIILVKTMGLNGIKLATIISMLFCSTPWLIHNLFNTIFKSQDKIIYYVSIFKYASICIIAAFVTFMVCNLFSDDGILKFLTKAIICIIVPNCICFLFLLNNKYLKKSLAILKNTLKI